MRAVKTLCRNSVDIWLRKMSEVTSFKTVEDEGEGDYWSQNTKDAQTMSTPLAMRLKLPRSDMALRPAARIRDLTSSFSPLGRRPSASSLICLRTGAAGISNSPFQRPLILCFSAHLHCSGSKGEAHPVYNQHGSLQHDDATQGGWGDGD